MRINADFDQQVVIKTAQQPWVASPLPGVERRMLDRVGEEVARATSIVRYAPESFFSPHTHGGGEEFFVLEGVFSDEHGDYGAGHYVRNPPGSSHKPFSKEGCTIFVKLWQMEPDDQTFVRTDSAQSEWSQVATGVEQLSLYQTDHEQVSLIRCEANSEYLLQYQGGEEILILQGECECLDTGELYVKEDWIRKPGSGEHRLSSKQGQEYTFYLKTGHLASVLNADM